MARSLVSEIWCSATRVGTLLLTFVLPFISGQRNGDLRLVGGHQPGEGRVEVYRSGNWGTVCDDGWDVSDAAVVCRQLGYPTNGASAICCAHFGQGSGPILMDDVDCTGSENTLNSCTHLPLHNCGHGEDAGVRCHRTFCQNEENGNLRLVSGSTRYEGRVEVCLSGRWGTVCDYLWSVTDAQVACRQLGYNTEGVIAYHSAHFGQGAGPILLDNLDCSGSESRLVDCFYDSHTADCSHTDDAGIRCLPYSCNDGELRLVGGLSPHEGQVEICLGRRWGRANSDVWSTADVVVVCRQLGYTQGAVSNGSTLISQRAGPVLLNNVTCSGSESRLLDCSYVTPGSDSGMSASIGCLPANCQDGDVRLAGGFSVHEGTVEVCIGQRWGTVCHHSWSTADGQVVCKQLGYSAQEVTRYRYAHFGQGTGPIQLVNVLCSGFESRLLDCIYDNETSNCRHSYDAGLSCQPFFCKDGELRLIGGGSAYEGRVEMCLTQRWGTVHDYEWSTTDAQVVCRQLGYDTTEVKNYSGNHFGEGDGPTFLYNVACSGYESRLLDCSYGNHASGGSDSGDAGVGCLPYDCQDGDVRLVGDLSAYKGGVEVCLSQGWGTVCSEGWSTRDAQVVCRQLGYPATAVPHTYLANYKAGPWMIKNVGCYGPESHLLDCSYSSDTHAEGCNAAGVHCVPVPTGTVDVISGVRIDPRTIEIEFFSITKEENNGEEISLYVVTYSSYKNNNCYITSADHNLTVSSSAGSTTALIGGLEASQEYCVAVAAKSEAGTGNYSQTLLINKYSSARVHIEMTGEIVCNAIPISIQSMVITSIAEQLATRVKDSCHECTFTVNNIREGRLTCCGNRLDTVAYQARIISSHDVSLDTIKFNIEQWIATKPAVQGANLALNVLSTWQYGLSEETLYTTCSSELEQDDSSSAVNFVILWIIVAVLAVVIFVLLVVLVVQRCLKKKAVPKHSVRFQDLIGSEAQEDGSHLRASKIKDLGAYSVPPDARTTQRKPGSLASAAGTTKKDVRTSEWDNYEEMTPGEAIYEVPD